MIPLNSSLALYMRDYSLLMNYPLFQKHLPQSELRSRFKKQCLKPKNILFENEHLQIGCKVGPLYDLYSSSNYLHISLFIGNKSDKPLDSFRLDFRGTSNLEVYLQDKQRSIKERTQYKERIIVGCSNYQEEILILMDFQSPFATLKSTPLPITLYSFCSFSKGEGIPPTVQTEQDLQAILHHKYEYNQDQEIKVTSSVFKKGIIAELQKYFPQLSTICQGVYIGHFTTKTLIEQFTITMSVMGESTLKICLSGNEYGLFDCLFSNFKFLLQS